MRAGAIAIGDEVIIVQKHACYKVDVLSIQIGNTPYEHLDVPENQEIGLRFAVAVSEGALLMRLPASPTTIPQEQQPELLSPDESLSVEPVEVLPDVDLP
jgi:hypothetical protein